MEAIDTKYVIGTYRAGKPVIRISKFSSKLSVISSKQRPRRLSIVGSDGVEYQFMLKGTKFYEDLPTDLFIILTGHEDLRQDERVMQLFGLVNTLLAVDGDSFMRNLHIQRYTVIPLAANVGLIQWVLHSDTMHVLIKDYRDSRKILLNFEYRLMLQVIKRFRVNPEAFEYSTIHRWHPTIQALPSYKRWKYSDMHLTILLGRIYIVFFGSRV
jgi:FKBP12-rapamycin complex-associated protein